MQRGSINMFIIICLACFIYSCGTKSGEKKFFDMPTYFKNQISTLENGNLKIKKLAVYNSDTSRQEIAANKMNWNKELAIFVESDINKPVYFANMKVDTISYNNQGQRILYSTTSPKLMIKKLQIDQAGAEEFAISIHIEKSNLISATSIDAMYIEGRSYFILGEQQVKNLGSKNIFFVEGIFYQ